MILFRASFRCSKEQEITCISAADTLAKHALKLPACAGCSVYSDAFKDGEIIVLADWRDRTGLDAWISTTLFRNFFHELTASCEAKADIRIYEMSELQRL